MLFAELPLGLRMDGFWQSLVTFNAPRVFNPWRDVDTSDAKPLEEDPSPSSPGPAGRLARLRAHFDCSPRFLLVGEAPGYQGCHISGIPFTNEALLLKGSIPRMRVDSRLTTRPRPWCEPSATIMWGILEELGIADQVVLWNAFAWHPHKPENVYSNRTPSRAELTLGHPVLKGVLSRFRGAAQLLAVGQVAAKTLAGLGHAPCAVLRHPAMGGANQFREGLRSLLHTKRAA